MTYESVMQQYAKADELDDLQRFGTFLLIETLNGRQEFWKGMLESHDTDGLPFDLIYLEIKRRRPELLPESFTSEMFCKGIAKARRVLYV